MVFMSKCYNIDVNYFRYLITGEHPKPLSTLEFYQEQTLFDVIGGNLFDADTSYSMVGFTGNVIVNLFLN